MLYLSGEMLAYQQKDDRYREALKSLADECGFSLEIRSEERPGLTQVHLFDIFYQDFEKLLHNLHQEFPRHAGYEKRLGCVGRYAGFPCTCRPGSDSQPAVQWNSGKAGGV